VATPVTSVNDLVPLSGPEAAGNMLQFKAGGHVLGFQPNKAYLAALDHALSVEFLGTPGVMPTADAAAPVEGARTGAPALSTVVYRNLWDDITLTYAATKDGITESTYQVAPGADVAKIRLRYNVPVELQGDGSLKLSFATGYLTESPPVAWQEIERKRVRVTVAFRVSSGEVGFSVGEYDRRQPLIIDPVYEWHTFYGSGAGSGEHMDLGKSIAVDGGGNIYVTGESDETWGSPLHAHSGNGNYDIFVLKLNNSGAYQ
jgi:hypothetical protein